MSHYALCPTEYYFRRKSVYVVAPFKIVADLDTAVIEVAQLHTSFGYDIVPVDIDSSITVSTTPSFVRSYKAPAYKKSGDVITAYEHPLYDWARTAFDAWRAGDKVALYYACK